MTSPMFVPTDKQQTSKQIKSMIIGYHVQKLKKLLSITPKEAYQEVEFAEVGGNPYF